MRYKIRRLLSRVSLGKRILLLLFLLVLPPVCMLLLLLFMVGEYSMRLDNIMSNLRVVNEYNMNFKSDMEYSMYRVMIGQISPEEFEGGDIREGKTEYAMVIKNPLHLIDSARHDFSEEIELESEMSDGAIKLRGILYCLDSLEDAVNRMFEIAARRKDYAENQTIWENDILGLCSMIQDYITEYIYYETGRIQSLKQELGMSIQRLIRISVLLMGILFLAAVLSAAALARSVSLPIRALCDTAKQLGEGNFEARAKEADLSEINLLVNTLNRMSEHIRRLMERTREEQKHLRMLELRLRQVQINPHFLYNTLDSIIWLAEMGDKKKVVEMTTDLSDFFRTVLSEGRDFIKVSEERMHIRSYLEIQKIRYEDVLDYSIEIEPEIMECTMLKMILQPIVENALYHGIKKKRSGGKITVRGGKKEEGILFSVEDNGSGMNRERLHFVREQLRKGRDSYTGEQPLALLPSGNHGSFGIKNVAQRIRMYYGHSSSISIESEEGKGTKVEIFLKNIPEENKKILL
ncbi:MAG: sensor histidine kinase [Johnsonella sp.]|nr:sensor histidine kinase [Johnsonella sp.]